MDEKDGPIGDHLSAHLIEVVVAHLRKKNGADIANGQPAMADQKVFYSHDLLICIYLRFRCQSLLQPFKWKTLVMLPSPVLHLISKKFWQL